jgi:hypothetical protein
MRMNRLWWLLVLASLFSWVAEARAQEKPAYSDPPSDGTVSVTVGGVLGVTGLINLAAGMPLCAALESSDAIPGTGQSQKSACLITNGVIGGTELALGVVFVLIGQSARDNYRAWRRANSRWVSGISPVGYSFTF